jgi:hypothetical protein
MAVSALMPHHICDPVAVPARTEGGFVRVLTARDAWPILDAQRGFDPLGGIYTLQRRK